MLKANFFTSGIGIFAVATIAACSVAAADAKGIRVLADMPPDGNPYGELVMDSSGNLYGTTLYGGDSDHGTVFRRSPKGRLKIIHSFGVAADDGSEPVAGLVMDAAGNLYGTTLYGGAHQDCVQGCGAVFKISPDGTESVVYSFTGLSDGAHPATPLILDERGNLYGTAQEGGTGNCAQGCGVIFKISPKGQQTVLYAFAGDADGAQPTSGLLLDRQGNYIGETGQGGDSGNGTIYKLSKRGVKKTLYSFAAGNDGAFPTSGLIMDWAGNLYGTTYGGGSAAGDGTVFRLSPTGKETVLHAFTANPDGAFPAGRLTLADNGALLGTTPLGGGGQGTVFKITPEGTESIVYAFSGVADGGGPEGGLTKDSAGNLDGTARFGGANGGGTLFRLKR